MNKHKQYTGDYNERDSLQKYNHWHNLMLKDITAVQPLDGYRLKLHFEDGLSGIVDLTDLIPFEGVFAPLRDRDYFVQVRVNPEIGTIC